MKKLVTFEGTYLPVFRIEARKMAVDFYKHSKLLQKVHGVRPKSHYIRSTTFNYASGKFGSSITWPMPHHQWKEGRKEGRKEEPEGLQFYVIHN
jgi:hypothetical protein